MRLIAYILKQLKVPFTNEHLRWIFWTHPDRDNLLGYARILSYYGIETNAKKNVSLDTIDERYLPCISYLTDNKFIIIKHISSLSVVINDGIYDKKLSRTKFVSLWNGIILQIKKTESASEPFYKKNKNNTLKKVLLFFAFSVLTLTVIIAQRLFILSTKTLINIGINIIACYTSFLLYNKPFTLFEKPNICSIFNIFHCNLPKKKIFKIELSDIGISYFGAAIIILLLFPTLYPVLSIYYVLAIPFSIWSILYQVVWVKKICPYCTLIQILIFFLAFFNLSFFSITGIVDYIVIISFFMFLLFLIESLFRPYYENIIKLYEKTYDLNVCKVNLLKHTLNNNNHTKTMYNDTPCDIQLGMECANNNLIVIINLYCRSCGIEYIKVYNSLKLSQTIKTQFVIACWSKEQRDDFSILLSLRTSNYPIDKIIFDWFSYGKDFFLKHYYRKNIYRDNMIVNIISSHYKWFKNNNIKETPTCILNGRKLSSNIRILDIINTI